MEHALFDEMIRIGKLLYERGFVVATEGNFSVRLQRNQILCTPGGISKHRMQPDDLVLIDEKGNKLRGEREASTEILLHLKAYEQRPDISAAIHAHPPYSLALMLAGKALDKPFLPESVILLGKIPVAAFALPSTEEVPNSIAALVQKTDCLWLERHGSFTVGKTLQEAFLKLEIMEQAARIYWLALQTGDVKPLPSQTVKKLQELRRKRYGIDWPFIPFE